MVTLTISIFMAMIGLIVVALIAAALSLGSIMDQVTRIAEYLYRIQLGRGRREE